MSILSRLFGKSAVVPKIQQHETSPKRDPLELPKEFDGSMTYTDMFRDLSPERLKKLCDELPVEHIDLDNPGKPPNARAMGRAVTQVFGVSTYIATTEVPKEYGQRLFPRLVKKITSYNGASLHPELCDLVMKLGYHLEAGGWHDESVQVLSVLRQSAFWYNWGEGNVCLFAALSNRAFETKLLSHRQEAMDFTKELRASDTNRFSDIIRRLKVIIDSSETTADDLLPLMRRAQTWGEEKDWPNYPDYPQYEEIREIGRLIYRESGHKGMQAHALRMRSELPRFGHVLDHFWHGIGEWVA